MPAPIELITGVEINALSRGIALQDGELHILGFGMDLHDEAFEAALAKQRAARRIRFEQTIARLREIGMPIDDQLAGLNPDDDDALGRPTIARALIAAGFATSVEDAFRRLIGWGNPAYVPREGMGPREAIAAILAAGGIPVLAHFSEAPDQVPLLRELKELGLAGLEVYYRTFLPETVAVVAAVAAELGLLATGGSDYHGDLMSYAEAHAVACTCRSSTSRRRALVQQRSGDDQAQHGAPASRSGWRRPASRRASASSSVRRWVGAWLPRIRRFSASTKTLKPIAT